MTQDSTFEFERKRNMPERYDRNLTENTLKAIKKIDKVRVKREATHIAKRMKGKRSKEQKEAAKELEPEHPHGQGSCSPPPGTFSEGHCCSLASKHSFDDYCNVGNY